MRTGVYKRVPHIFWGWWRSPAEYARVGKLAGLVARDFFSFSASSKTRSGQIKKRSPWISRTLPLRGPNSIILFAPGATQRFS